MVEVVNEFFFFIYSIDCIDPIFLGQAEYAVSDPVDTTNTASPTSASGNVAIAGDLNDASDLSQNQSKCGCFLFF